jgi:hypothetical protein
MKTKSYSKGKQSQVLICSFIGHRFKTTQKITNHLSEYECRCCGKQMTEDPQGRLVSLTPELKEINDTLRKVFQRKRLHS